MTLRAEPRARGVPAERPRVRRGGDRAVRRAVGPRAPLPGRRRAEDGQARAVRPHLARGVRRRRGGRRLHQPVRGDRGDRPGRPVDGDHPRGRGRPRDQPDPHLRHRRAEADLAARPGRRPDARRLRPHRARRRLRRGRHQDQGGAGRRRVGGQRRQAVHHQLRLRDHQRRRVTARTGTRGEARPRSARSWCPSGTEGFTAEKAYDKLGWHASDTHPLSFEDCRVPEANLLGDRGRGYAQFLATLDDGRVAIAALAVGCIQACLDLSVQYAGERQTFGVPIGRKQGVAFQIADLEVMLQAAPAAHLSRGCAEGRRGARSRSSSRPRPSPSSTPPSRRSPRPGSRPRSSAATASWRSTPWPGFYRDAKVLEIGEGTSEVQRMLIARGLGLPVE